jgi:hypothetical protein
MKLPGILRLPECDKAKVLRDIAVQVFCASVFVQDFGTFSRANISIIVTNTNRQRASVTDDHSSELLEKTYK